MQSRMYAIIRRGPCVHRPHTHTLDAGTHPRKAALRLPVPHAPPLLHVDAAPLLCLLLNVKASAHESRRFHI